MPVNLLPPSGGREGVKKTSFFWIPKSNQKNKEVECKKNTNPFNPFIVKGLKGFFLCSKIALSLFHFIT